MTDRIITFDELVDALADVGGDGAGDCAFDPMTSSAPDHHGREFADAIWESVERDRQAVAELVRGIKA